MLTKELNKKKESITIKNTKEISQKLKPKQLEIILFCPNGSIWFLINF